MGSGSLWVVPRRSKEEEQEIGSLDGGQQETVVQAVAVDVPQFCMTTHLPVVLTDTSGRSPEPQWR